jgi:hypothetical protein
MAKPLLINGGEARLETASDEQQKVTEVETDRDVIKKSSSRRNIEMVIAPKDGSSDSKTYNYTYSSLNNVNSVIITPLPGKLDEAKKAIKDAGFQIDEVHARRNMISVSYDGGPSYFRKLRELFHEPFIKTISPNSNNDANTSGNSMKSSVE